MLVSQQRTATTSCISKRLMQRPYWSHQKMSIRDLRQRNEHNRRQCRQAVPWRPWGVYRWLPPSRGYGCWGHHCTLYIPQAPAATRSMSPRTPRRVPHHQPLVGDRVNATAVEMMPTRIPHSFASRAIVHHISPRPREEEQVQVFFFSAARRARPDVDDLRRFVPFVLEASGRLGIAAGAFLEYLRTLCHFPILRFGALVSVISVRMALRWVRYLRHPI